jgi:tRNA 5-methylaminomethyl-2-thiouridine biosynthesis bifunctional protein
VDAARSSPILFDDVGPPRSHRYGDVYFSREGGLEEARTVFLAGCGLPERWSGRRRFTVAELGFGTGLNVAALLDLWRGCRPENGRLLIFTVEAEPLTAEEAGLALAAWPELAPVTAPLLARWPGRRAGFHRIDLPELAATLDVAVMDAEAALEGWSGRADAWMLDGFSPAANPRMWSPALMRLAAERSATGAIAATYTVAGGVRRALTDAGFAVERRPGFGRKRQRLEARLPGEAPPERAPRVGVTRVAVIGAGIAGAALARAFRAEGLTPRVFEARSPGAGASGNPAALVTPRLDAGLGDAAQLHAQAFARAVRLYEDLPDAIVARGVLQLETGPRDAGRFARIAASDLFEPRSLELLGAEAVGAGLGEPAPPALRLAQALVIDPAKVLADWLDAVEPVAVAAVEREGAAWRLADAGGRTLAMADVVCLATGAELAGLWPAAPIRPVRGQLSRSHAAEAPAAAAWGAYVAPEPGGGIVFGATHDRDDTDAAARAPDDRRNLEALAARLPRLAAAVAAGEVEGRASIRATTADRLPLAGEIAPGLYVLGGFGARGFALAPLLGEHVAAQALGSASPLPSMLARVVSPDRFAERARRRHRLAVGNRAQ